MDSYVILLTGSPPFLLSKNFASRFNIAVVVRLCKYTENFSTFQIFAIFFDQKQTLNFHSLRLTTFAFCFLCKYTKKILKVKCFCYPLKRICRQQRTFLSVVFFWGFGHIDTSPIPKYHYERIVFFIDQAR